MRINCTQFLLNSACIQIQTNQEGGMAERQAYWESTRQEVWQEFEAWLSGVIANPLAAVNSRGVDLVWMAIPLIEPPLGAWLVELEIFKDCLELEFAANANEIETRADAEAILVKMIRLDLSKWMRQYGLHNQLIKVLERNISVFKKKSILA